MWILRFRMHGEAFSMNRLAKKHNVKGFGYPLSVFKKGGKNYLNVIGRLIGDEKDREAFLRDLKKSEVVPNLEIAGEQFVFQLEQLSQGIDIFSSELIYLEPIKLTEEGYQEYNLGSWDREKLARLMELDVSPGRMEVLSFKEGEIPGISLTIPSKDFTDKQLQAFKLAHQSGYYEFPRKTELKELAKHNNTALSTYQAHLRKAERKIMNSFYDTNIVG